MLFLRAAYLCIKKRIKILLQREATGRTHMENIIDCYMNETKTTVYPTRNKGKQAHIKFPDAGQLKTAMYLAPAALQKLASSAMSRTSSVGFFSAALWKTRVMNDDTPISKIASEGNMPTPYFALISCSYQSSNCTCNLRTERTRCTQQISKCARIDRHRARPPGGGGGCTLT